MNSHEPSDLERSSYPDLAFTSDGTLWWDVRLVPGTRRKFGAERRIAAWLAFNREEGETFTMRDLRRALGADAIPNDDEQLNRRLRALRPDGWDIPSNKDDRTLAVGVYRVNQKGWHPGSHSNRPKRQGV